MCIVVSHLGWSDCTGGCKAFIGGYDMLIMSSNTLKNLLSKHNETLASLLLDVYTTMYRITLGISVFECVF